MNDSKGQPLVSVIIPVFDCEKYLERCIKSVVSQTYKNLEIILIDDGSNDNSGEICDIFAQRDHRIKVIHQSNGGPGKARNSGLDCFSGEYVAYIDADDYVSDKYIFRMIELAKEYQADIVEVGYVFMFPMKNKLKAFDGTISVFSGKQELFCDYFSSEGKLQNTLWGRLFRRSVIEQIRFSDKSIAEDSEYSLKVFAQCGKLIKCNEVLYAYRAYPESVTRRGLYNKHFDIVDVCIRDMLLCEDSNVSIDSWQEIINRFTNDCRGLLIRMAEEKREFDFNEEIENIKQSTKIVMQIAKRHNAVVDEGFMAILSDVPLFSDNYRRKNAVKLLIKKAKNRISRIFAKIKVICMYEYKLDKQ